jgi:GNAT superfamily N-acetyltransferase
LLKGIQPIAAFRESEGLSLILSENQSSELGLTPLMRAAWITLTVHSDLLAVGLTAAFAKALTDAGISCNVVAAAFHDHIFVPTEKANLALRVLRDLQSRSALALEVSQVGVNLEPVNRNDLEALIAIRIDAMRESLERLGRFDVNRARERFTAGFDPSVTRHIVFQNERVGFVVLKPDHDVLLLDHLYVKPGAQGKGVGSLVLAQLFAQAKVSRKTIRVGALRQSRANNFYQRHGFKQIDTGEFDIYYECEPNLG